MRKFAERERAIIQRKLLEQGKRLFSTLGLKKTSVADLTKAAGISQGSFYLFYSAKEELYFDILAEEESELRARMIAPLQEAEKVDRALFKRFLRQSLALFDERPLLRQLFDPDVMETLLRKLPEEKLQANFIDDAGDLLPLIERGWREGWMAERDPEAIVSVIRSLVLLSLQRQQIGEARYEGTIALLIDCIAHELILES
jgi:AcrR family transcriptional regulator